MNLLALDSRFYVAWGLICFVTSLIAIGRRTNQLPNASTLGIVLNDYAFTKFSVIRLQQLFWALAQSLLLGSALAFLIGIGFAFPEEYWVNSEQIRFKDFSEFVAISGFFFIITLAIRVIMEEFMLITRLAEEGLIALIDSRRARELKRGAEVNRVSAEQEANWDSWNSPEKEANWDS